MFGGFVLEREFLLGNELEVEILKGFFEIGDGFERGVDFIGGQEVEGLGVELFEVGNGGGDAVEVRFELRGVGESGLRELGVDGALGVREAGEERGGGGGRVARSLRCASCGGLGLGVRLRLRVLFLRFPLSCVCVCE
ncbi:hypothetical protein CMV_014040 [Castanea mollissima]|uniref:Uncharacterized protein n=1 Tax=Castanea mollissima TaxID=60419 RepID=A0A8J4VLD2_9ROSI|nr:hypothetical protein CMV_014040 [Castanea mollissima]